MSVYARAHGARRTPERVRHLVLAVHQLPAELGLQAGDELVRALHHDQLELPGRRRRAARARRGGELRVAAQPHPRCGRPPREASSTSPGSLPSSSASWCASRISATPPIGPSTSSAAAPTRKRRRPPARCSLGSSPRANCSGRRQAPLLEYEHLFDTSPCRLGGLMTVGEATDELADVPTERLEAQITELAGHLAAAECRWLGLVGEFDRRKGYEAWGCISCAYWLSWHCGLDLRSARDKVRVARALEALPLTREQFAAGSISYSKVRAITRVATPATEADLVMLAEHVDRRAAGSDRGRVSAGDRSRAGTARCARPARAYVGDVLLGRRRLRGDVRDRSRTGGRRGGEGGRKAAREAVSRRTVPRNRRSRARPRRGRWWRWPSRSWPMVRRRARTGTSR